MGEPQQLSRFGKVQIVSTVDASFSMTAGRVASDVQNLAIY